MDLNHALNVQLEHVFVQRIMCAFLTRQLDSNAMLVLSAYLRPCMILVLPARDVTERRPLAGLAHLFTLATKPNLCFERCCPVLWCCCCSALLCSAAVLLCCCSARCAGPTPQRGHDGRRLNQQNLYLLLITFAKCHPDTRSAILRV